jgi:hypothetical protein
MVTALWAVLAGLGGVVLAYLWAFTDHAAAYRNENVLQVSFLALLLIGRVPGLVRGWGELARRVAVALVGLSALGLFLKLLPLFFQVNGEIIALALPIHLGVAAGIAQYSRR